MEINEIITHIAACTYALASALAIGFQIALAAGAPWGEWAMAGRFPGRLPPMMRVAAVLQALLLTFFAVSALARSGVLPGLPTPGWAIWMIVGFSGIALTMNSITPSPRERKLWAPVALVMLISSVIVALYAN